MPDRPDELILVYDGDSGLRAMLLDVVKKAVGLEDCPLCQITFTPIGRRRAWLDCQARLGLPTRELHRDELPATWNIDRGQLPCILARTGDASPVVFLSRDEIAACQGQVDALERRILEALAASPR